MASAAYKFAADHPAIAAFETAIAGSRQLSHDLCEYELRWPLNVYRDMGPGKLSDHMRGPPILPTRRQNEN